MRVLSIFLVFVYFLCGNASLVAQQAVQPQPGRAGGVATIIVTEVDGTAELLSKAEVERQRGVQIQSELWKPALPRTTLGSGDQLRTRPGASMKLQLNDGTVVRLSGDSTVVIEDLRSARGQAPQTTQFLLEKGKISTQQTARILGQTDQIIRTENGTVNTRLAEVEVWKPAPETQEYALLAAHSSKFPLVAKKLDKSKNTYVTLNRGTVVIESAGKEQMITNSILLPETCPGQDGVELTLDQPKFQVAMAMLEEDNGYRVISNSGEDFYLDIGTEGMANQIRITTKNSPAEVAVEGLHVGEWDPHSTGSILMHPLLTVGVKSKDVLVNIICDETESKGLNEIAFREISGNVYADRTVLGGRDTGRPVPSRGRIGVTPTPAPPGTPTERPEDDDEEELTPTPEEEEVPPPSPPVPIAISAPIPPSEPIIADVGPTTRVLGGGSCQPLFTRVEVTFEFWNNIPSIFGGEVVRGQILPYIAAPFRVPVTSSGPSAGVSVSPYNYMWPQETGNVTYWVCIAGDNGDPLQFTIELEDNAGNVSNTLTYDTNFP